MTWDQISGPLDRVLLMLATWLVAKGYLTQGDAASYVSLAIAVIGAVYGWWVNRPKAILESAAALPDVQKVVISDHAMAASITSSKVDWAM